MREIPKWAIMHINNPETAPKLIKYNVAKWLKYFGVADAKLLMTDVGAYSIARPSMSQKLIQLLSSRVNLSDSVITETHAGLGGFSIPLARHAKRVHAIELDKLHSRIIANNAKILIPARSDVIRVHNEDYGKFMFDIDQDIIISDPPWGGHSYRDKTAIDLGVNNINIVHIINQLCENFKLFVLLAPSNYNFNSLFQNIDKSLISGISVESADAKHYFIFINGKK